MAYKKRNTQGISVEDGRRELKTFDFAIEKLTDTFGRDSDLVVKLIEGRSRLQAQIGETESDVDDGLAQTSPSNPQQKPPNLVAIDSSWRFCDEGCQYCDSFAKPVNCSGSMCNIEGCDDCMLTLNGKRLCPACKEDIEHPELKGRDGSIGLDASGNFVYHPLAKVLMFPVGATPRHARLSRGGHGKGEATPHEHS